MLPECMVPTFKRIINLKFDEEPDYEDLISSLKEA